MDYEDMLNLAEEHGLLVKEKKLTGSDGLVYGRRCCINRDIRTTKRKSEVLAEEICHKDLTVGDITEYNECNERQEIIARNAAYRLKVPLSALVDGFVHGCRSRRELAEYLDCTEEFLVGAIEMYSRKYWPCVVVDGFTIQFHPAFSIYRVFEGK